MEALVTLAALTLLVDITFDTGFIVLRPFVLSVLMMLFYFLYRHREFGGIQVSNGLVLLIPFFVIHVFSAFTVGLENGLREFFATSAIFIFAAILASTTHILNFQKLSRLMVTVFVIVLFFVIGWHISNGHLFGWKKLGNLKAVFLFLPLLVACVMVSIRSRGMNGWNLVLWILWIGLGVLIMMSGERKAWLAYGASTLAMVAGGRLLAILSATVGLLLMFWILPQSVDDSYLATQVNSLLPNQETDITLADIAAGEVPLSLSNAQRRFATELGISLFADAPILGVGTNTYLDLVDDQFKYLPSFLTADIHNEFQRVLIENGIVGFLTYVLVWGFALARFHMIKRYLVWQCAISRTQAAIYPYVLFCAPFVYLLFEGSGVQSFAVLASVSLTPDFFYWAHSRLDSIDDENTQLSDRANNLSARAL